VAFFLSLASCPDAFQIGNFAIVRLFIIYDLIDGLGDRSPEYSKNMQRRIQCQNIWLYPRASANGERARSSRRRLPGWPRRGGSAYSGVTDLKDMG